MFLNGVGGDPNPDYAGTIPQQTYMVYQLMFAIMVHITSGVSALVCALYLGKRDGYPNASMRPHSVVLSVIGACLL